MEKMGQQRSVHVIGTGGTVDGIINVGDEVYESAAVNYLTKRLGPNCRITSKILFLKDSRAITHEDREAILEEIKNAPSNYIAVSHGTITLVDTARCVEDHQEWFSEKRIVVVGSKNPLLKVNSDGSQEIDFESDAPGNLDFVAQTIFDLDPGTWVAMHGRNWNPYDVRKYNGEFVPTTHRNTSIGGQLSDARNFLIQGFQRLNTPVQDRNTGLNVVLL